MAIRHREVFPVGSAPDSISWEQWNDEHAVEAADGTPLTFGAIADGEFLKRVGDEIVGAAGEGGVTTVEFSVAWNQLDVVGGSPTVGKALHITPAQATFIWGIGINLVTLFDDTALAGGGQYAGVEKVSNNRVWINIDPANTVDGHSVSGVVDPAYRFPFRVDPSDGADFILNLDQVAALDGNGTAGLIEIAFLVS